MRIQGGITGLVIGPPGTGKSTFLGSIAEVEGVEAPLLLSPKPREVNSFKYREHEVPFETFKDHAWHPILDMWEATQFDALYKRIVELYADETYDAIILDPFTDVVTLAEHHLLVGRRVETPGDLPGKGDKIAFFGDLKSKLKAITQALTGLADPSLPRPKHVFVAVHAQAPVEEDIKGKETKESRVKGVEYMGDVLPMLTGGYRLEIASEFDLVMFSALTYETVREGNKMSREARYVIQVNADPERHAKAAIVPVMAEKIIPNSMPALWAALEEAGA